MSEKQIKKQKRKFSEAFKSRDITIEDMEEAYKLGRVKGQKQVHKNTKDLKKIKNMCEVKTLVTGVASDLLSAGLTTILSIPAQGTTSNQRVGAKVKSYSIRISGIFQLKANIFFAQVRIMIVLDFSQQGVKPPITAMFQTVADFYNGKPRNLAASSNSSFKRLIVIYDNFWVMNSSNFGIDSADAQKCPITLFKMFDFYQRVNHYIYYSGSAGLEANARQGNIYMMSATSVNLAVTPKFDIVWKFTDS